MINPDCLNPTTAISIAATAIDRTKNKVINDRIELEPLVKFVFPVCPATWLATVGARLTPTRIIRNPVIKFPNIFFYPPRTR